LGALLGLGASVVGQALVAALGGAHELTVVPSPVQRLAGAAFTACLFGGVLFFASLGALVAFRRRRAHDRRVVAVVALVGAFFAVFHLLGLALRILMGSPLTRTGLEFFANSVSHIVAALTERYVAHLVVLTSLAAVVALGLGRLLRRVLARAPYAPSRAEIGVQSGVFVAAMSTIVLPVPAAFGRAMASISPELAFFASIASDHARDGTDELGVSSPLAAAALVSPSLEASEAWGAVARENGARHNVVLVMLEAVAPSHVGYLGYGRDTTPHLDRIAEKSRRMTRAYSTATHSNYAQMAVLSSLFPRRGQALDMYHRLDYPRVLLHDLAHSLGHASATISSQDETWQGMLRFQRTATPVHYVHALDHVGERLDIGTEQIVPDHVTAERAVRWIGEQRGPFSLYVNFQSTHFPYVVPRGHPKRFAPDAPKGVFNYVSWSESDREAIVNRYDNALAYVDAQVGALYDALDERGLLDDTVFVVTSDHGEMFFEHGVVTHGRTLFDGEARVPLLVHHPSALEPGDDDAPVSTLDVLPTIVDLLELPPHPALQGTSFAHRRDEGGPRPAVFLNIQGWTQLEAIVCEPFKLVHDPGTGRAWLYDLERDPGETRDLATDRPDVAEALRATLAAQVEAQLAYHASVGMKTSRFAPRMLPCPDGLGH
jgi:arylsulfatase A-like enzyme